MTATRKLLKLGLVYLDGPSLQHHTPTPSLFSHSNCVKNTIHKASPLHHDPRWVSLSGTSSSCSLYLPFVNTNCTASTSYSPFLYSKDNTLWIESRSPRALDMNCTVSIFSLFFFFFYLVKLLYGSTPLVCGSNRGISFPIETSCFTLDSCVNSSEGLRYMRILSPLKGVVHNVGARRTHTHSLSRKTDVNHLHHIHLSVHYKSVLEGHMVHKWLVLLPYNKKITSSIPSSWVSSLYSVLEFKNMP